jgi:hypothetical protein
MFGWFVSVGSHFRQHLISKKVGDDRKVHRCRVEALKTWGLSNTCRRQLPLVHLTCGILAFTGITPTVLKAR